MTFVLQPPSLVPRRVGAVLLGALCATSSCDDSAIVLLPPGARAPPAEVEGDASSPSRSSSGCERDEDCPWSDARCNVVDGRCVRCLVDADCDGGEICEPISGRCAESCSSNQDCDSWRWLCDDARGVCVECTEDAHCLDQDDSEDLCVDGDCVECLVDADCPSRQPLCEPFRRRCRECLIDADCDSGQRCEPDGWCERRG